MGQAHFPADPENGVAEFTETFETETFEEMGQKLADALKRGADRVEAHPMNPNTVAEELRKCPHCAGQGKRAGKPCIGCGGTGQRL